MSYLIKWHITKRKGLTDYASYMTNWVQASEFILYDLKKGRVNWPEGTTATSVPLSNKANEAAIRLTDNNVSTKWAVDTRAHDQIVDIVVTFTLPTKVDFAYYSYCTANDVPKRDPVSWALYDSTDDGASWNLLDERNDITISDDRQKETEMFATIRAISRDAIEEDYNLPSRTIEQKIEIYFNGLDNEPLVVTRDDFLIDTEVLEETCADDKNPFGAVSSNELSISMYNDNGIFSPTNPSSPYFGKIRTGIPIMVYTRPCIEGVDIHFDRLGTFYVTDWRAAITGITVEVTANDELHNIFNLPQVKLPVERGATMKDLFSSFFTALGVTASVDDALTEQLVYAYNISDNKSFLNELSIGAQSYVFCNRLGIPRVEYARGPQELAHTLTDTDQVINISSMQSVLVEFTGAEVVISKPQESSIEPLLSITELMLPSGEYVSAQTAFNKQPVYKITGVAIKGSGDAHLEDISASSLDVTFRLRNGSLVDSTVAIDVLGTHIEIIKSVLGYGAGNVLSVDNRYVQTDSYAARFLKFLRAYINAEVPVLDVEIRGNPKYLLGEKLRVISTRYAIDFTGVLIRQQFRYDGGLSSTIRLINSDIMEVL